MISPPQKLFLQIIIAAAIIHSALITSIGLLAVIIPLNAAMR